MNPQELFASLSGLLWDLAEDAVNSLAGQLAGLQPLPGLQEPALAGRLLDPLGQVPAGNALLDLIVDLVGDMGEGSPIRIHGWQSAPGSPRGVGLVASQGTARAVLAVTPGPVIDIVMTPGPAITPDITTGPWHLQLQATSPVVWAASLRRGQAAGGAALGSVTIQATRRGIVTLGPADGPGVSLTELGATLRVSPDQPLALDVELREFRVAVLPPPVASLLGASPGQSTAATLVKLHADRETGFRFAEGGVRTELPGKLELPGVSTRGFAMELVTADHGFALAPKLSIRAELPALPFRADLDGLGVNVPLAITSSGIGVDPADVAAPLPDGIGVELTIPPVSGGGDIHKTGANSYAGVLDIDLGVMQVQAIGLLQLPADGQPMSLLVLLAADFPFPGIQLSFGFAIDAVGGIVGINRRVDAEQLRGLVSDGNADRVMFPGNAVARAEEIAGSLERSFPVARGRFLVGPMLRINWGGRILSLSAAVILDLPDPAQIIILGRLVIALPDPILPLIRLQASVFGRIEPAVPSVELLVSLAGSWIAGIPITGEIYLLFRGGSDAVFVFSAGGFHPRYTRPARVPELRRLSMDLGGGGLGLRAEAYLAVTSNSVQFGAKVSLDATIAGCGVEGYLGLDALFVWEPTFFFSVHVYAGVAVLAFGHRLASVGLDFTLEGPGSWHAFGTGSISLLFLDVTLDFDVRWGSSPSLPPSDANIHDQLGMVLARRDTWSVQRPLGQRTALRFTKAAHDELAAGTLAHPDSTLRLSQRVVPLGVPITRYQRAPVPEQTWRFASVKLSPADENEHRRDIVDRFVPGEFFTMTDDEQMSRPAFEEHLSGLELTEADVVLRVAHQADDSYETDYETDADWFGDQRADRLKLTAVGKFGLEGFARTLTARERVDQWRAAQLSMWGLGAPVVVLR